MNWLFIHQNFPAQFVHVARHLAALGDAVVFITQQRERELDRVRKIVYAPPRHHASTHPFVREFEAAVENGIAVARICTELKRDGFVPDLVVGHNGWGEILYIKDCWPDVPLLGYFEFFYRTTGSDLDFDPEFLPSETDRLRNRTRNAINLLGLETVDWGQTPTEFQRSLYPERFQREISVVHEGIDTELVHPEPSTRLWLSGGLSLSRQDPIVTYSARNLEPYRGFHIMMRSLPRILERHPTARVLVVGENGVSYGRRPTRAPSWREQLLAELGGTLDLSRVHFLGRLPYPQYLAMLRISSAHVYLTYPFVLSWGMLEAMAAGCCIVASRTPPVEEVVRDGENGHLVDFFDTDAIADRVGEALRHPDRQERVRAGARRTAVERYDLATVCLPAYLGLLNRLIRRDRHRSVPRPATIPASAV
ncbi:MAG TPA: glycosyltransferase family 4 protein [Stellaceae bacterium]|nr:glycosyltransferase family 4 protein [Stellaceae bacterium]